MSIKNSDIETNIPFLKVFINNQKNINQIIKDGTEHIENYKGLLENFKILFNDLKKKLVDHLTKIKDIYTNMNSKVIELDDIKIDNNVIKFIQNNNSVNSINIKNYITIIDDKINSIDKISTDVKQDITKEQNNTTKNEQKLKNNFLDLVKNQKNNLDNIVKLNVDIEENIKSIVNTTTQLYNIYQNVINKLGDEIKKDGIYEKINNNFIILKKFSLLMK